ncbi:NAD-dependent epimerase/dehydratase family protein [Achromobacter kerstersii]|jgi:nucleoside-diphosphate-sugar epimerase|uniref:NAD-dependent epimerase/dehydratase family protein n=1 Tax=Achromobacter kerstersii TaxID=1353890 RepID=UPI003209DE3D
MTILITGGTGFVGQRVVRDLLGQGHPLRLLTRRPLENDRFQVHNIPDLEDEAALQDAVSGVEFICHLAGRAHILGVAPEDHELQFDRVNVQWSARLARLAFQRGVKRFVFVSSIGAVGANSQPSQPLTERTPCQPTTPYGRSKLKAEQVLADIAREYSAELVVVRPPLVYGAGAPGNMARMARWVRRGVPLPLASIRNQRSLVHVDNLSALLVECLTHPQAPGHVFHVRDPHDYSTPEILRAVGDNVGRPARLFPVPTALLRLAATAGGQRAAYEQLAGWLQVDDTLVRETLGFKPKALPFEVV